MLLPMNSWLERQAAKDIRRSKGRLPVLTIREAFVGQSVIRPALRALAESVADPAAVPASKAYFDVYLSSLASSVAQSARLPPLKKRKKRPLPATNLPAESNTDPVAKSVDDLVTCKVCRCKVKLKNRLKHMAKSHPDQTLPAAPKSVHVVADGNKLHVCEVCKCNVKLKNLAKHQAKSHPGWTSSTCASVSTPTSNVLDAKKQPSTKKPTPQKDPGVPCPKGCGWTIWPDYMETHLARHHAPKQLNEDPFCSTDAFPFELLPPGAKDLWQAIERKLKISKTHAHSFYAHGIDKDRFRQIELLNPIKRHLGEKAWLGYVVYEFARSSRVVLECAIEGNAVYILPGDWKKMIYLSKAEIRNEYENRCTRVFHTGNWIHRVSKAL
jgi:hypothetical protein